MTSLLSWGRPGRRWVEGFMDAPGRAGSWMRRSSPPAFDMRGQKIERLLSWVDSRRVGSFGRNLGPGCRNGRTPFDAWMKLRVSGVPGAGSTQGEPHAARHHDPGRPEAAPLDR